MAVTAKALLGLPITLLILSVIRLVLSILNLSALGIAVSILQLAVCSLGIAGAVTLNRMVLIGSYDLILIIRYLSSGLIL